MKVRLVMNKSYTVQRFKPKYEAAQKYLDNEVLKDCTPYVPMDTGQLMRSGINATVIGSVERTACLEVLLHRYELPEDKAPARL